MRQKPELISVALSLGYSSVERHYRRNHQVYNDPFICDTYRIINPHLSLGVLVIKSVIRLPCSSEQLLCNLFVGRSIAGIVIRSTLLDQKLPAFVLPIFFQSSFEPV